MRKNFGAKPWTYPQPVFILATYGEDGTADAMNAAWGGISEEKELSMCISAGHKTTANILARKAFTVSMATAEQMVACDYVGIESGNNVANKLEKAGWHTSKAEFVDAPLIDELPMAVECRLVSYDPESCRLVGEIVNVCADESVLGEDGKIDTQALEKLLLTVEKIAENSGEEGDVSYLAEDSVGLASPFAANEDGLDVMSNADAVGTTDVGSLSSMMVPYAVMRQAGLEPETVRNMYHPLGTVGINSASGQKELAEEFVKYLFSDEIQSAALIDGFPVLLSALDGKVQEAAAASGNFAASVAVSGEDGIDMELVASYPEEEEVRAFTELCRTLDTPMEQNRIVWNIYQEEADSFMEGSAGADEAAKNIAQKVDTYLAEQE